MSVNICGSSTIRLQQMAVWFEGRYSSPLVRHSTLFKEKQISKYMFTRNRFDQ